MIQFKEGVARFNFRAASVLIHQEHVLIHKNIKDTFWALPGGRVEFFEHSHLTVEREFKEELGWTVNAIRPLFYLENFFTYNHEQYHEISNIFLMDFADNTTPFVPEVDFYGIEQDTCLVFRWIPLSQISQYDLKPAIIAKALQQPLPSTLQFLTHSELSSTPE